MPHTASKPFAFEVIVPICQKKFRRKKLPQLDLKDNYTTLETQELALQRGHRGQLATTRDETNPNSYDCRVGRNKFLCRLRNP